MVSEYSKSSSERTTSFVEVADCARSHSACLQVVRYALYTLMLYFGPRAVLWCTHMSRRVSADTVNKTPWDDTRR